MKLLAKKSKKWWMTVAALLSVPVATATYYNYISSSYSSTYYYMHVGTSNWSSGNSGNLLVGYANGGYYDNSAAIGSYLTIREENSLVVGSWNEHYTSGPNPLFTVANGTEEDIYNLGSGSYFPKNLFEVYGDGAVIIKERQGDISMGVYGN